MVRTPCSRWVVVGLSLMDPHEQVGLVAIQMCGNLKGSPYAFAIGGLIGTICKKK